MSSGVAPIQPWGSVGHEARDQALYFLFAGCIYTLRLQAIDIRIVAADLRGRAAWSDMTWQVPHGGTACSRRTSPCQGLPFSAGCERGRTPWRSDWPQTYSFGEADGPGAMQQCEHHGLLGGARTGRVVGFASPALPAYEFGQSGVPLDVSVRHPAPRPIGTCEASRGDELTKIYPSPGRWSVPSAREPA